MIEVAVGEKDRLHPGSELLGGGEDPLRLLAGVDDQDPFLALGPDQETVLANRADGEHLDIEAHYCSRARIRARSRLRHIT